VETYYAETLIPDFPNGLLETSFSPWMCRHLNVSHGALASIRTCIKEIFNNIIDHSEQDTGFIHAQYYPVNKIIYITVSDFGKGIPTTIKERFGDMTDQAAIFMASQEGVTAKSQPNNMGAGLNYLIDRVTGCYGSVRIHSLGGNLNCFRDRKGTYRKPAFGNGNYPGTLIDISLDTRLFEGDEEERVDFEW
jgi:glucose-6-phosphate-specific signal transduction histidine kinase